MCATLQIRKYIFEIQSQNNFYNSLFLKDDI